MGGVIEEKIRSMDSLCKELNLEILSHEKLYKNSDKIIF